MTEQPQPELTPAAKLRKQVFVGFASTVTIGLCLGGWYVSARILVARPPSITQMVQAKTASAPAPVPVPSQPAEPKIVDPRPAKSNLPEPVKPRKVDPRPGETYLQIAAMGPRSTEDYLKELAVKGIHPSLGPGPSENLYRLLIGPYAKAAEREKEQRTLEGQGIQVMVRKY